MGTPLRLLLLEDNPSDAALVMHALRSAGYDPVGDCVETEQDFLDHLQPPPEIILADFTMPEFDSLRALEILRERRLDIPFIIVSGTIGEERAVQVMQHGATDYIIKDRLARLGPSVEQALARWRLKDEKQKAEHNVARLAAIVESSGEAIITKTLEGVVTSWNRAAENLYGYSAEEIIGTSIAVLIPLDRRQSDVSENLQDILATLSRGEYIEAYETVRIRKDRRRIEVLLSISPVRDANGEVAGASAIAHDITQRKRSERYLNAEQSVTGILTECKSLKEAGPRVLHCIGESLRWEIAVLWTVDRKANVLCRMYSWQSPWAEASFTEELGRKTILEPGVGVAGRTWSSGEVVWEPGIRNDGQGLLSQELTREGMRGAFGLPMRHNTEIVGVIEFYNPELREPDKALLATLDNIACQIGQFCEQRRTEAALRTSEVQYRMLADSLPGGVYTSTADGERDYCNQWWCDYTGLPYEQLLGKGWATTLHADDREQTLKGKAESRQTGQPFQTEHRFRAADGSYRWFLDRCVPHKDENGPGIKWFGTCLDIDDRKRAEAERNRLFQRLQLQIERMPLAYILGDADFRIVDWNPTAQRIFGFTREEMLGTEPPYEKIVPRSFWENGAEIRRLIRAGDMQANSIHDNLTKDGRQITCEWFNTPLMDDAGQFAGFLSLIQDITERKSLEEQFRQSQKMEAIGQLAGGVAHDFNNLLTVVSGYSEMLLEKLTPNEFEWEAVKEISHAGERAAGLTRQLLSFSRRAVLETAVLDFNEIVEETEKLLRRTIGEDILLAVVLEPNLRRIKVDPGQMVQVLMNLAVNARDAMPKGGKLTIETSNVKLDEGYTSRHPECKPGDYVKLAVSDNGCGMTPEVKAHVYEPFFTTKGPGQGTGLGLATVYGIIKQSGGGIDLHSEPGLGTTFNIYLPAVEEQSLRGPLDPTAKKVKGGIETVLVVEDEGPVRTIAILTLRAQGYTVLQAESGKEALETIRKHRGNIDILLTDVVMPAMSGRDLADALGILYPRMKVLYMSGFTDDSVIRHGILQAEVAFLQKPFTPLSLARKVREVLDKK